MSAQCAVHWRFVCVLALAACSGSISEQPGHPGSGAASGSDARGAAGNGNGSGPNTGQAAGSGTLAADPSQGGSAGSTVCTGVTLGPRRLWRLTPAQYDNTLRDLLGVESNFGAGFPADEVVQGFDNASDVLLVTPLLADKMQVAAQTVAAAADLSKLVPCAAAQRDENCLRDLAGRFGERAFRRAMQPADVDRYLKLAKLAPDFESGARLMLTAMLQSPHFLYRFELGKPAPDGRFALDDYEVASELSYLLWQSMPDDALFTAARSGQLHTGAQVTQQVERMLTSPRARPVVRAFVFEWLGLTAIRTVPKDTARFPELTNEVRESLVAEAERFIDHVMFEQRGSIAQLLTSPTTFLDDRLAGFYGVAVTQGAGGATRAVELPEQDRRGILTLGGTMLAHSRSNDSSPVHRGKLIRERLLCQPLPPPPPGIVVQPPPLDPTKTTRERYAAHASVEPCATCHRLMDPIGLAFEHFDGIGRFRATDNGLPIDVHGMIVGSPSTDGTFDGTDELIDTLQSSEDTRACYALQWFRYAFGFNEQTSHCLSERVQSAVAASDGSLAAIISVLTQSDSFLMRQPSSAAASSAPPAASAPVDAGSSADAATLADAGVTSDAAQKDAGAPEPTGDLPDSVELTVTVNNDFGSGYCRTYQLKNHGTTPVTWSIPLDIDGRLNQHWECQVSGDTGRVTFSGEDYNRTLDPGGTAQFGFCAQRS